MQRFSISFVSGTNRVRIVDELTGASEEITATDEVPEAAARRPSRAISFMVPTEVPSMKVCVIAT